MFVHSENQEAAPGEVDEVNVAVATAVTSNNESVPEPETEDESSEIVKYLWEQRDDESDKEYKAFKTFADLGSGRSYGKAALQTCLSKQTIFRWSKTFDWLNRID